MLILFGVYETKIDCQHSQEELEAIMDEAIDRYLALHHNVFPLERQHLSVELKVQKNYLSPGEIVRISIQDESFRISSKCIADPEGGISIPWGKNRTNVHVLANYIQEAMQSLSFSAA